MEPQLQPQRNVDHLTEVDSKLGLDLTQVASNNNIFNLGLDLTHVARQVHNLGLDLTQVARG